MKSFKRFLTVCGSTVGIVIASFAVSGTANAALITCGGIQIEDTASCVISGSYDALPASFNDGVTSLTIAGGIGNSDITVFNGFNLANALCGPDPFQTTGTFGEDCRRGVLSAASSYLVYVFETSRNAGDPAWVLASATGQALLAGVDYLENSLTGAAKYKIYVDPREGQCTANCNPVPVPSSIALLALGLLAIARKRS
jgi:PEP-CTERM motif